MTRTALNRGFAPYILLYLWQSWRKSFVIPRTSLYRGSASVHTKQDKISIISYRMISNASTELEQLVHTHRTSYQSCWPRGLGELTPSPMSRIFFSVSVDSSPRSHLFTPVILPWQSEHLSVHTAPKYGTESISYVTFHFQDQCSVPVWTEALSGMVFAPAQELPDMVWK